MASRTTGLETAVRAARPLPAWLMSLVLHLLALIALATIFRSVERSLSQGPDRPVSVVLAQRTADQTIKYWDEDNSNTSQRAAEIPFSSDQVVPAADAERSLLLKDITLPGRPEELIGVGRCEQFVHVPQFHAVGRRPILPGEGDAEILAEEAARQRLVSGPAGPSARVGMFGSPEVEGHKFAFVIDRSKSMGGDGLGALDAAAKELISVLARLEPNHQFQIIAYHHHPTYVTDTRKMLPATPENLAEIPKYFAVLAAFGSTDHEMALLAALRLRPDVVFFLTDGGDPYLSTAQLERITERAAGGTAIHCLQFGFGPLRESDNFMMQLARRNRGSYGYIDMSKRGPSH